MGYPSYLNFFFLLLSILSLQEISDTRFRCYFLPFGNEFVIDRMIFFILNQINELVANWGDLVLENTRKIGQMKNNRRKNNRMNIKRMEI